MNFKALTVITLTAALPLFAHGVDADSKAGFKRLQSNVENAKGNLDDYKKNLGIVEGNITEASKARTQADRQKAEVASLVKENKASLQKIEKQEKDLNGLIKDEQSKITAEDKELKQLEAMVAKLKENRAVRETNIQSYQSQIQQMQAEKQTWVQRDQALGGQQAKANQRAKELASTETEWKNKKKGYEAEISRWSKELDKQRKNLNQYETLAEKK
ncbi:MAG TPA: hypothetical protein PL182_06790 [Pseudobdellovibrionaceae bacterium]|nr:hypothetical protein [Pseudobdellovibrionaceae bacterium]